MPDTTSTIPPSARARADRALVAFFGEEPVLREGAGGVRAVAFVDDDEDEDDGITWFFATTGLSSRPLGWAPYGAELIVVVTAALEEGEARALMAFLVQLGEHLSTAPDEVRPGMLLSTSGVPVFEGMRNLFVGRWDTDDATDGISFVSVCPLYDDEAVRLISGGLDEDQALAWLDAHGVDVDDPYRPSAVVAEEANALVGALASGDGFGLARAVSQLGERVTQTMLRGAAASERGDDG